MSAGGRTHQNINVYCRFRPSEPNRPNLISSNDHIYKTSYSQDILLGHRYKKNGDFKKKTFETDLVFDDQATQKEVFQIIGKPIVEDVLSGFNGCILCYGQTGSGKTHTLFGDMNNAQSPIRGLIPRCTQKLFEHISDAEDIEEAVVKCSFLEIYNNKLGDLLMPKLRGKNLKIREKIDGSVYVQGIHEEYVNSFEDIYNVLQIGFRNRTVAATVMNRRSSRGHCILSLRLRQIYVGGEVKLSRIHFGDLGGSERVGEMGKAGDIRYVVTW